MTDEKKEKEMNGMTGVVCRTNVERLLSMFCCGLSSGVLGGGGGGALA